MADSGGQEKTEKPTPRRLSEARNKGNIAKSADLNTAVMLLASILILKWQLSNLSHHMMGITEQLLGNFPRQDMTVGAFQTLFVALSTQTMLALAPILGFLLLVGLLVNYSQVGVLFTFEPLKPSLQKINPLSGFKRLFSLRSVIETLKALIKMGVVAAIIYGVLAAYFPQMIATLLMGREGAAALFATVAWEIAWRSVAVLLFFALLDLFYQRWEFERGLKMTKQEIKDESKQSEGDPLVKGRFRRLQREAAKKRMMQEVPKATVVITNPTHYAVALRYDRDTMGAPLVVAKGVDLIAQRIKALAAEHDVPTVENVALARELYRRVELGDSIPEDLYTTIAEILVMVQRLKARRQKTGTPSS